MSINLLNIYEDYKARQSDFSAIDAKNAIINYLKATGYTTYADRLECINFYVVDVYKGIPVDVAFMIDSDNVICINPDMLMFSKVGILGDKRDSYSKMFDQLSVLVRHELLHFMLKHTARFINYLKKKYPKDWNWLQTKDIIRAQRNISADYHLSKEYDDKDKEIVRLMTLSNNVIGGLILEDDHPEWITLDFEELLDKILIEKDDLIKQIEQEMEDIPEITVVKVTNTPEYEAAYNAAIAAFDGLSDAELQDVLDLALAGEEIKDSSGNIIINKGEN